MSRLWEVIRDCLDDRTVIVASGSRLREDLGLDSLQLAVLTVKIEAEFGVDVFADGVVTTVGEIEEKIRRHQAETGASNPGGDVANDQGIGDTTTDVEREQAGGDPVEREQSGE